MIEIIQEIIKVVPYIRASPATIKSFFNAIGIVYEPNHIRRIAKAESDAALTKAKTAITIDLMNDDAQYTLKQRAILRNEEQLIKQQTNIETIAYKAIEFLKDDAKPESIDDDWINYFFGKSKNISDVEMQLLWAKLLAQEANENNSVSKRTLSFLKIMDKKDAVLFEKICQCSFTVHEQQLNKKIAFESFPFIRGVNNKQDFLIRMGLNFNNLQHLQDIGLIQFNPLENILSFSDENIPKYEHTFVLSYGEKSFFLQQINNINMGEVLFTKIGLELSKIVSIQGYTSFLKYVEYFLQYKNTNYILMDTPEALKKLSEQPNKILEG